MAKRTQETNNSQAAEADFKGAPGLDDLIRRCQVSERGAAR
ncbi:hypothetical protein [Burkholderia pseudomallei]|nr:hypothetical protein [Burkholderia pseudomallei]